MTITAIKLPEHAAAKLATLRRLADEAQTLSRHALSNRQDLENLRGPTGMPLGDNRARIADLEHAQRQHAERHWLLSAILTSIKGWIDQLPPHVQLEETKAIAPKPLNGQTIAEQLVDVRAKLMALDGELFEVRRAPAPRDEAKAFIKKYVADLVERGKPVIRLATGDVAINFGGESQFDTATGINRILAVAAWFDPENMVKRLEAELARMPERDDALSREERAKRIAKLQREIDQQQRLEEAIIERAEAEGVQVSRRPTASPAAILGVRIASRGALRAVA